MVLCGFFPSVLVAVFRPSGPDAVYEAAVPLAVFMVRLVSVYLFADALGLVLSGALRGAGDTFVTMCLSVASHWVLALTALVLVKGVGVSPRAAWVLVVLLVWGIGIAFLARYRAGHWRRIRLIEPGTPPSPDFAPKQAA
jgi:MATE family multidrug resistance protein